MANTFLITVPELLAKCTLEPWDHGVV